MYYGNVVSCVLPGRITTNLSRAGWEKNPPKAAGLLSSVGCSALLGVDILDLQFLHSAFEIPSHAIQNK